MGAYKEKSLGFFPQQETAARRLLAGKEVTIPSKKETKGKLWRQQWAKERT